MTDIVEFFGVDIHDGAAWELLLHLNAPRFRLVYETPNPKPSNPKPSNPKPSNPQPTAPTLTLISHSALRADCPRHILFDGIPKPHVPVNPKP